MQITLSPVRGDAPLSLERHADVLTINGEILDLSGVPDGATLPAEAVASDLVVGAITRQDGVLSLTLNLPHGANAPEETRFPAPLSLTTDGPVDLPPYEELENV